MHRRARVPRLLLAALCCAAAAHADEPASAPAWTLDSTHTFVYVELPWGGLSTTLLRLERKQGTLRFDRKAKQGRVEIRFEMANMSGAPPALDALLRGPQGLDVARFPEARFDSEAFEFDGDRVTAVRGRLRWRDVSEALDLRATRFGCYLNPLLRREVCGGDFEGDVLPARFGVTGLPERLRILVQVEAISP